MTREEIAEIVREVIEDEYEEERDKHIIPDGGSVSVPMHLCDGESISQLRARTSDAYQIFLADREEYFRQRDEELRKIARGDSTPSFDAAVAARDAAWTKRGAQQTAAWQQKPPANNAKPLAPNAPLADAMRARDEAWRKRGEQQANAWRR